MPYLVGRLFDPILGLGTGVMAYFLWENDARNAQFRPDGRTLPELVQRRLNNVDPPPHLYEGESATQRSLFHIPSNPSNSRTPRDHAATTPSSRSTEQIISDANDNSGGSSLKALRTAITDEWNQKSSPSSS
ncbi:hypothetical protein BCV70DRAFT_202360 [Testicularia cyperi]|uniref:Uncharacterized protein n=1 Tax=Testicularia cyperi TaxID=1882483 RepID=A0A317XJB2_9BASI|nr:hypothetical protein BCV70DRAFT_202360 [Testicularia cyperi]